MSKEKMTVTIEQDLIRDLDRVAASLHQSRSRLVETAIRFWNKARLEHELAEGYRVMAGEDLKVAEDSLAAEYEALK
jgi:metal-responsive CopG/Arc/MetJ family transcriptional regulator